MSINWRKSDFWSQKHCLFLAYETLYCFKVVCMSRQDRKRAISASSFYGISTLARILSSQKAIITPAPQRSEPSIELNYILIQ